MELLTHTVTYIKMLYCEVFHKYFTLDEFDIKEYMHFDLSCVKFLNLFDVFEKSENVFSVNTVTRFPKSTVINGNLVSKKESVFTILNKCCTKFGGRVLHNWLMQPLQDIKKINERLDLVQALKSKKEFNNELRNEYLIKIDDIEAINVILTRHKIKIDDDTKDFSKIKLEYCGKLQRTINIVKNMYNFLMTFDGENKEIFNETYNVNLSKFISELNKLDQLLNKTISFEEYEYILNPSLNIRSNEVDDLIERIYRETEDKEEENENIENSDLNNNTTENLPNSNNPNQNENTNEEMDLENNNNNNENNTEENNNTETEHRNILPPIDDLRSMTNEEKEDYERLKKIQSDLVNKIIDIVVTYQGVIDDLIKIISNLDIISTFALLASKGDDKFTRPIIKEPKSNIVLENSRHILLEYLNKSIQNKKDLEVIPNDLIMNPGLDDFHLLTGISKGGKSIYLKQIGICVILAHIGCFVPATKAEIPLIDKICIKVWDEEKRMRKSSSSYFNQMFEVYSLLKTVTKNSLLLIDEFERRNSIMDEVTISAGTIQYICEDLKSYCVFVTPYTELNRLEEQIKNLKNYYMDYTIEQGKIVLAYKVKKGIINNSLGVDFFNSLKMNSNIKKAIDKFSSLSIDIQSIEEENYIKRMNRLKIKRQSLLGLKRRNDELSKEQKENNNNNSSINIKPLDLKNNNNINKYNNEENIINLNILDQVDSIIKSGIRTIYNCICFYNNVVGDLDILRKNCFIHKIEGDKYTFYKCLSQFLYGKIDYYQAIKNEICNFCKENVEEINNLHNEIEIRDGVFISTLDYIKYMDVTDNVTNVDITVCCYLFGITISIYMNSKDEKNYDPIHSYIYEEAGGENPLMILLQENKDHYNILYPNEEAISKDDKNKDNRTTTDGVPKKKKKIRPFGYGINPFPKYAYGKDKDLYLNIFNFLFDGVINGRRTWPEYIENMKDQNIKHNMKSYFYRKVGLSKSHKNPFNKNESDAIKEVYSIENNRLHVIRYEFNNNFEKKLVVRKYMIPYVSEINYILNKCYDKNLDLESTINAIKNNNYYWITMNRDVAEYIKSVNPNADIKTDLSKLDESMTLSEERSMRF